MKGPAVILVERMAKFLSDHSNGAFCNDCLRELLDVESVASVARVTAALGKTTGFRCIAAGCSICARQSDVIQALPQSSAGPPDLISRNDETRSAWRLQDLHLI
jgi:hypothetical protein